MLIFSVQMKKNIIQFLKRLYSIYYVAIRVAKVAAGSCEVSLRHLGW